MDPILLTPADAAKALGITRAEFYRNVAKIIANHGLHTVVVGRSKKYPCHELAQIVAHCAQTGEALYET